MRGTVRKAVTSALKVVVLEVVPCWQGISFVFLQVAEATHFTNFAARIMTVMVISDLDHLHIIYNTCSITLCKLFRGTIWHTHTAAYTYTGTSCRCCWQEKSFRRGSILVISPSVADNRFSFICAPALAQRLALLCYLCCFSFFGRIHYRCIVCIVVWNPLPYFILFIYRLYSNRIDLSTLSFMAAVLCLWTCQNMPSFQACEAQYIS